MISRSARLLRTCDSRLLRCSVARHLSTPAWKQDKEDEPSQPTIELAKAMPISFVTMDNHTLITVAAMEHHEARVEVLKRHIMAVDEVSYEEACKTFAAIARKNRDGMWLAALPYQVGIALALVGAFGSIPMVFDLSTTLSFNEVYVTTDVPPPEDLETGLEVGAWAWNWMEPPLGTLSFALLCLQFSRAQMGNLGVRPYTTKLKEVRGRKLADAFPKYDRKTLMNFSETDPMVKLPR